jgi:hypothetical protein
MKAVMDMRRELKAEQSKSEFNRAFVALQKDLPAIQATKPVPNNDGTVRYKFAPFEELMKVIQPYLTRHGFSVTFNSRSDEGRLCEICTLIHEGGHERSNEFSVRIGKGPPGSSETQADGAAMTYAKRGALCNCLNIVIEKDDDARNIGTRITPEQAKSLRERVQATASDEKAFLKYAGAATFEDIETGMFATLDSNLRRKEKTT